jgi:hypothetical protein
MPEERRLPRGSRAEDLDLPGVHLHGASLEGARLTETYLMDAGILGDTGGLRLNGAGIEPLVRAELDRRYPDRVKLRARDAAGLRGAWSMAERLRAATTGRALRRPGAVQRERAGGEWSIVETLRHLVLAAGCWLFRAIRLEPGPYHPWGPPWPGAGPEFTHAAGVDTSASPSLEEVMPVRVTTSRLCVRRSTISRMPGSPRSPRPRLSRPPHWRALCSPAPPRPAEPGAGAPPLHRARPRRPRPTRGPGFLTALTATRRDDPGAVDFRPSMFRGSGDPAIAVAGQTGFKSRPVTGGHTLRAKSRYGRIGGRLAGRPHRSRMVVMATGAVVCLPFEDDVESPVTGQMAKCRSTRARRRRGGHAGVARCSAIELPPSTIRYCPVM